MLASRVLSGPGRSSIFQLPPSLRVASIQHATSRQFSASTSRKAAVDTVIAAPLALIDTIHAAGIPWYAAIPTAALFVRGYIAYYISAKPAQKYAQTVASLGPVLNAAHKARLRQLDNRDPDRHNKEHGKLQLLFGQWLLARPIIQHFHKSTFGLPGMLNFGILVAMAEAIRMKCGAREGLLPLLLKPFGWIAARSSPASYPDEKLAAANAIAAKIQAIRAQRIAQAQAEGVDPSVVQHVMSEDYQLAKAQISRAPPVKEANPYFDASLQDGGFSWCPDLTIADPSGILPVAFFAAVASGTLLNPANPKTPWTRTGIWRRYGTLQKFGLVLYACLAYISQAWPAGIALYITSSFAVSAVQRRWLKVTMPVLPAIQPCARPTRVKVRKEWRDLQ